MTLRLRSGRAPAPCFETSKELEEAARQAEERKRQAIERLAAKLTPQDERFRLVADRVEQQEKGR